MNTGPDKSKSADSQAAEPVTLTAGQSAFAFPAVEQQRAQRDAIVELGSYGGEASAVGDVAPEAAGRPGGPNLIILDEEIADCRRVDRFQH
ncbi:hypothetical protein ACPXB3_07480 [Gordonia sp. DT219]|uniref:hypothetical protein n=1 Tax=Gordonia sp. DT219 TaxID=3416658 RepID=UPI003CE689D3